MIEVAATPAYGRREKISNDVQDMQFNDDVYVRNFGLFVDNQMVKFNGKNSRDYYIVNWEYDTILTNLQYYFEFWNRPCFASSYSGLRQRWIGNQSAREWCLEHGECAVRWCKGDATFRVDQYQWTTSSMRWKRDWFFCRRPNQGWSWNGYGQFLFFFFPLLVTDNFLHQEWILASPYLFGLAKSII